jgi:hypothetical protein
VAAGTVRNGSNLDAAEEFVHMGIAKRFMIVTQLTIGKPAASGSDVPIGHSRQETCPSDG